MRVPERVRLIHAVATPAALDSASWPPDAIVLRIAPDAALVFNTAPPVLSDPHAIVQHDDGYAAVWLSADEAADWLARYCAWELPPQRPAFAQGAVAGLPVKLWLDATRVLVLVPAPYATDLEERLR